MRIKINADIFFLCLITCQARDSMKFLSAFLKYRHMGLCRYRHNIPAFPINADDFFLGKPRIRAYNYQPLLPLAFIADVHKFCQNAFAFFFNRYRHRILLFLTMAIVSGCSWFFSAIMVFGAENQLSNKTYRAVMPAHWAEWVSSTMTSVAFRQGNVCHRHSLHKEGFYPPQQKAGSG